LAAGERLLLRQGFPVNLGARSFDILVVLASRPNEIVSKKDLLAQVWPDVTVDESNLRFQVASLRKALGDGKDGARYIATLTGRGYCFVARVSRSDDQRDAQREVAVSYPQANLPSRLMRMVGRNDDAVALSTQLVDKRFITVVGTGGIGKTTVAVAVGHELLETFVGAVHFVDLGALSDPRLVAPTVAAMVGLLPQSDDVTSSLIAYLADKRILLIFDTCEHVIDAAAYLTARIFASAPEAYLLATSREPLQVEGEHIYKLGSLACAPDDLELTASTARSFPAIQLFLERAAASAPWFDFQDEDAGTVAGICRKLDGLPLAIELAAGRVASYGLQKTAVLLNERLTLVWPGQRTAPQRQKTLQATLDWSYGLLSDFERHSLRRLTVFIGHFSIEAAVEVATSATVSDALVLGAVDSLVAKSMVAASPAGATMHYRLLDTTRAYALQLDIDAAEFTGLSERHATYYLRWLVETGEQWPTLLSAAHRSLHLAGLANVRVALDWCFGPGGNTQVGIRLAAEAAPVFLSMSLLTECHRWAARAVLVLDDATSGGSDEMHLQVALGVSLMYARGGKDAARVALIRSLAIADRRGDALEQLQILGPLQQFYLRRGEFRAALHYADRCSMIAETLEDPVSNTLAHYLMGVSLHLAGELDRAQTTLEAVLRYGPRSDRATTKYLGFDGRILSGSILARTLWLQGHPDRAVERALLAVEEAEALNHPLTLSIALFWAVSLLFWVGDLKRTEEHIDRFVSCAELNALGPYFALGRAFKGELAIRRGNASSGVEILRSCLSELHAAPLELLTTPLNISLAQGLAATGRSTEARSLIDETIRQVEIGGDLCYMAELLRLKGSLVLAALLPGADEEAELCFRRSLELSNLQGARAWELRAAVDLASLLAARGRHEAARAVLQPILAGYEEGFETKDLQLASQVFAMVS
jgi:predicted ATPase/DNA-binding winged helix-turn-helix (wHTH) protein